MTTPAPLAERRTNALDGLTHITGHTDHYCRPLTSSPGWSCSARPRSSRPYAEPSRRMPTAMHDHSDPWAPIALLFAAVLFAGAGIDWHAVTEAAHTAAAYGLALLAALVACAVVSAVAPRRPRAKRVRRRDRPIIGQPAYWGVAA